MHLPQVELSVRLALGRRRAALGHLDLNGCSNVFLLLQQFFQSAHRGLLCGFSSEIYAF